MVCYTGTSERVQLETFCKRAGTFKRHLTGDWAKHLYVTLHHKLTLTNQINSQWSSLVNRTLHLSIEGGAIDVFSILNNPSVQFFAHLSVKKQNRCYCIYTNFTRSCQCCLKQSLLSLVVIPKPHQWLLSLAASRH